MRDVLMGIVVGALGYWLYRSEQAQQRISQVVPEQVKSQASSAVQSVSSRVQGLGGTGQAQAPGGSTGENVLSEVDAAADAARKEQQQS